MTTRTETDAQATQNQLMNSVSNALQGMSTTKRRSGFDRDNGRYHLAITRAEFRQTSGGFVAWVLTFDQLQPKPDPQAPVLQKWFIVGDTNGNPVDTRQCWHRAKDFKVLGINVEVDGGYDFTPLQSADPTGLVVECDLRPGRNGYPDVRFDRGKIAMTLPAWKATRRNATATP